MKKVNRYVILYLVVLFTGLIFLGICVIRSKNYHISKSIGVSIPREVLIKYKDTHGGFLGDGTTFAKITFDDKNANKILAMIKKNKYWNKLPLSNNIQLIMYGGIRENTNYTSLFEEYKIPKINNGYWTFIDRYDNQKAINEDRELFRRNSYNFTLAVYDMDKKILYYMEYDS